MQAEIKLSPELENALKVAINTAAQKIADNANRKSNEWPLYMNKGTAAKYLSVSHNTLNEWISAEDIPFKHIGNSYRFNRNELDKFMANK